MTPHQPLRCLLVEDDENDALLVLRELRGCGAEVTWQRVETAAAMQAALDRQPWDAIIADYKMPHFSGLAALELLRASGRDVPFIAVSGTIGEDVAVAMMKAGANDYLMKGNLARLLPAVERELREAKKRRERKQAQRELLASEEQHRAILQSAMDGFWLANTQGRLLEVNDTYCRMSGYSVPELLAMHIPDLETAETAADTATRIQKIMAQGEDRFETLHRRKDGSVFTVEVSAKYQPAEGGSFVVFLRDVTARQQAGEALLQSRQQLRALSARLETLREEERASVAREIHDVLAQALTLLKMDAVWLSRRLDRPLDADQQMVVQERLAMMTAVTDTAIQSVQKIATELRPVVLDSLGLCAAVEWQARDFQKRTGIACAATVPEQDVPLDWDRSTAMFRIMQESLTNVLRHAQATRVEIVLRPDADQLVLRIQDNGCGISPETQSNPKSIGLIGMRERALLLAGQLDIRSHRGAGTTIEVRLPLLNTASEPDDKV